MTIQMKGRLQMLSLAYSMCPKIKVLEQLIELFEKALNNQNLEETCRKIEEAGIPIIKIKTFRTIGS